MKLRLKFKVGTVFCHTTDSTSSNNIHINNFNIKYLLIFGDGEIVTRNFINFNQIIGESQPIKT